MSRMSKAFNIKQNAAAIFHRPQDRFALVDGIRAFSIIYVLFFHGLIAILLGYKSEFLGFVQDTPWFYQWVLMGDRGVDSFFVISGFLIGQLLFKEHDRTNSIDLKRFFTRRWLRLTPAYLLIIVFFGLAPLPEDAEYTKAALWSFVFYVNNFFSMEVNHLVPIAWSLAVEEQFYIIFSLFLAFGFYAIKNRFVLLMFLFLMSFVIRVMIIHFNPELMLTGDLLLAGGVHQTAPYWELIYDNLYTRYGAVMVGIIIAYLFVYHWDKVQENWSATKANIALVFSVFLIVITSVAPVYTGDEIPLWLHYTFHTSHRNLFALAVGLMMLSAMLGQGWGKYLASFLSAKFFYPVSQLSYSIYLVHLPILIATGWGLRGLGVIPKGLSYESLFVVLVVAMIPILIVSALLYILVEKPFMNMRK